MKAYKTVFRHLDYVARINFFNLLYCKGPDSGLRIGCFADDTHDRDLPYEPLTDPKVGMWPPMCIDHCFRNGYYYAGVQVCNDCLRKKQQTITEKS